MAPLSHFHYLLPKHLLVYCLFLSLFFASSISLIVSCNEAHCSSQSPRYPIGRRSLLKTKSSVEDDEDEKSLVQSPKKKKHATNSDNHDDYDSDSKKLSDIKKQKQKLNKFSDEYEDHDQVLPKKKKNSSSFENEEDYDRKEKKKVKPISNSSSSKNQTKMITKTILNPTSSKNKTKRTKAKEDSTPNLSKPKKVNKLNTTSSSTNKPSLDQSNKPHNKAKENNTEKTNANSNTNKQQQQKKEAHKQKTPPMWLTQDDDHYDLVSEFTDLPAKFQQTFVPDLQKISTTSQAYLTKANKEITKGFKPYVGYKYATSAATVTSFTSIVVPFVIIALLFRRIKAHFSLQRLLIFIQIYLSVYFFILCLSSVITGLEPLRFLHATQRSTYNCVQLIQSLGYFVYLVLAIMYLLLVFSNQDVGPVHKLLGLAQAFVGLAVGLHYYMSVVHRMLLRQPPKSSWKVHGFYATCFFVMCLSARAERRKKAYLGDGGQQEAKKN